MTVACPECGKPVPDDQTFCKFCGALLAPEDPVSPAPAETSISLPAARVPEAKLPPPQLPPEKPRSGRLAGILAAVVAFLLIAGGVTWFVISRRNQPWEPGLSFSASAAQINRGQQVTLQWSAADTASMKLNDEAVPVSGSRAVSPAATTTYRVTALSRGGESQSREITVRVIEPAGPPSIQFSGDRNRIVKGESLTLSWSVSGAGQVQIQPGVGTVEATGTRTVSPDRSTEYILTADGAGGNEKQSFRVQVDAPSSKKADVLVTPPPKKDTAVTPTPTPPPKTDTDVKQPPRELPQIVAFEAEPSKAQQCQVVLLRWTVKGATRVTIDPAIGVVAADGYKPVILPRTTSYALKADGPGGSASQNLTVTIAPGNRADCAH